MSFIDSGHYGELGVITDARMIARAYTHIVQRFGVGTLALVISDNAACLFYDDETVVVVNGGWYER